MKKLFFLPIVFSWNASSAQVAPANLPVTPTGGCIGGYSIDINSIVENWTPVFTLINGHKYSLNISLIAAMEDCNGSLQVVLKNKTTSWDIGRLSYVIKGNFTIPLDSFSVPTGIYDLTVAFQIRYPTSTTTKVSVIETTDIDHVTDANGISIFPIPANDVLTIDGANFEEPINEVRLTDMTGRQVKSEHSAHGNSALNISVGDLPTGIYILQFQTKTEILNKTITIRH